MIMHLIARVGILFQPEDVVGPINRQPGNRWMGGREGGQGLSWKAVFWCLAAILISLGIGNLT